MILDLLITAAILGTTLLGVDTYAWRPRRKNFARRLTQHRIQELESELFPEWVKRAEGVYVKYGPDKFYADTSPSRRVFHDARSHEQRIIDNALQYIADAG